MSESKIEQQAHGAIEANYTPQDIERMLDRYIIGQSDAKKHVAIALRNRERRKSVPDAIKDEIVPPNILMIGPTGVGKTEIARRVAKLMKAPFIKVEATKFTEVGYVGRDVDSIIRDLVEASIVLVREDLRASVHGKARLACIERIIIALVGEGSNDETKKKYLAKFLHGELDDQEVEISIIDNPASNAFEMPGFDIPGGAAMGVFNLNDLLNRNASPQYKNVKMTVREAYETILKEEIEQLLDKDYIVREAIRRVEQEGVVFIDEIDKITGRAQVKEVSREGVQRDLLPLVDGSVVSTKYGPINTRHILFIAAGAFHLAKPSDLLPELQGRFPVRVELSPLSFEDMKRILVETEYSLVKQYQALLKVDGLELSFDESGIDEIVTIALDMNKNVENIGARRLHTVFAQILYEASYCANKATPSAIIVTAEYVRKHIGSLAKTHNLRKFIL